LILMKPACGSTAGSRPIFPGLGFGQLQKLLRSGQIRVDGGRVKSDARLQPGQTVRIPPMGVDEKGLGTADRKDHSQP
jgi:23S rRNA pseudouridine955/2504/2580 synthase